MAAYTSTGPGNWSAAIWTPAGTPGAGDTATINHAVAITADTTIGDGTATTVLSVATTASSLTITGAKLTVRGNATIGAYHSGTINDYIILNPNGSTPAILEFDGNSGVAPVVTTGYDCRCVSNGTASGPCQVRTKAGHTAAENASFTNAGNPRSGFWLATYTTFKALGNAGLPALFSGSADGGAAFATNPTSFCLNFANCTFDGCGTIPKAATGTDGSGIWSFVDCTWKNGLETAANGCVDVNMDAYALISPGVRAFTRCVFLDRANLSNPRDFSVTNCYFGDSLTCGSAAHGFALFDGNAVIRSVDDGLETLIACGTLSNNYWYTEQTTTAHLMLLSSAGPMTFRGNVAEYGGTGVNVAHLFGATEEGTAAFTYGVSGNIAFNSGSGSFANFLVINSNTIDPLHGFDVEHNTIVSAIPLEGASSTGMPANTVACKANVFLNPGSATGRYVFHNNTAATIAGGGSAGALKVDQVPASAVLANCWKGFSLVSGNPFAAVTGDTNLENGTPYYSPDSNAYGTTPPGAGDLAATDPGFFDVTRTLAKWGGSTLAAAKALLQATPTLTKSSLIPYVRAGYVPTNVALRAASYGGDASTADAAGTAWPGGSPGIGAMAYAAAGAGPAANPAALLMAM